MTLKIPMGIENFTGGGGLAPYIENCHVPENGQEGGWDVICNCPAGYALDPVNTVHRIYVEMKNKHNTMNSAASGKTYIKMQDQLLRDDDCCCFLVEAIARRSQNIIWSTTVDKNKVSHARIRRVSIDRFYEIVTGEHDAFLKICLALPGTVQSVLGERDAGVFAPRDMVYDELHDAAAKYGDAGGDVAMTMAMYMLGFGTYNGFASRLDGGHHIEGTRSALAGTE